MPTGREVRAGKAFVEVGLRDSISKGLTRLSARLKSFGLGLAKIGAGVSALGAGLLAPIAGAAKAFASAGDSLDKMSGRTGIAVESLSEFAHAAELSGASLKDFEVGIRGMQRQILTLAQGGKEAEEAFSDLGLSLQDIQGLSPEQQFLKIADGLSGVQDESTRAALAMKIFGKSGASLLPLINSGADGIEAMRKEARDLGLQLSTKDAKAAAELTDAIGRLQSSIKAIAIQIGAAVAGDITALAKVVTNIVVKVVEWVKENRQLVKTVAFVAAGVLAVGVALTGLGLTFAAIGAAISGFAAAAAVVAAVLKALFTPIGAVVALTTAGAIGFLRYTDAGQQAARFISGAFLSMFEKVKEVLGKVVSLLASGEVALAGELAMTELESAWKQGSEGMGQVWDETFSGMKVIAVEWAGFVLKKFYEMRAGLLFILSDISKKLGEVFNNTDLKNLAGVLRTEGEIDRATVNELPKIIRDTQLGFGAELDKKSEDRRKRLAALEEKRLAVNIKADNAIERAKLENPNVNLGLALPKIGQLQAGAAGLTNRGTFSGAAASRLGGVGAGPLEQLVEVGNGILAVVKGVVKAFSFK